MLILKFESKKSNKFNNINEAVIRLKMPADYGKMLAKDSISMANDRQSTLILVFAIFLMLISYPILGIFDRNTFTLGLPTLFFYFFFIWLALIVAVGLVVKNKKK